MPAFPYHPLPVDGYLRSDLQALPGEKGLDRALSITSLCRLCEGDAGSGRVASYAGVARTVGRLDGDGQPPPDLNVFDWGEDVAGIPHLRIWHAQQGDRPPVGVGAFPAGDGFAERDEVLARLQSLLRAPAELPQHRRRPQQGRDRQR